MDSSLVHQVLLCLRFGLFFGSVVDFLNDDVSVEVSDATSWSISSEFLGNVCVVGLFWSNLFLNLSQLVLLGLCVGFVVSVSDVTWNLMYLWSDRLSSLDTCQFIILFDITFDVNVTSIMLSPFADLNVGALPTFDEFRSVVSIYSARFLPLLLFFFATPHLVVAVCVASHY